MITAAPPASPPRRRLPEHHAQACYRAFRLQSEVGPGRRSAGGARLRDRAKHEAPFSSLPDELKASLQSSLGRALDDAAGRALLDGLARPGRLEAGEGEPAAKDVLYALRQSAFDAKDALRALAWLDRPVFSGLDRSSRRRFLAADLGLGRRASFRRLATALMRTQGLLALPLAARGHVLSYAIGPDSDGWASRRAALCAQLDSPAFRRSTPSLQAELLQDFLHEPCASAWVLQATALTGHAVVVLGDPADSRALSYGRRWVRTREGHTKAVMSSPDPSVRSGWRRPAIDAVTRYAADRYPLTRTAELSVAKWLESTLGPELDANAGGARQANGAIRRFVAAVEDALSKIADRPAERLVVVGGRAQPQSLSAEGTEGLLQAYLSA